MMSSTMMEARKAAEKYDSTLRADDPRFNHIIILSLDDGSQHLWHNAFVMYYKAYKCVFTEHDGFHVYHNGDVVQLLECEHIDISSRKALKDRVFDNLDK